MYSIDFFDWFLFLRFSWDNSVLDFEIDDHIFAVEILVLHHELDCWTEETSLELVEVVVEFVGFLVFLRDCAAVDAELGLGDDDVTVSEIYHNVSVWCF